MNYYYGQIFGLEKICSKYEKNPLKHTRDFKNNHNFITRITRYFTHTTLDAYDYISQMSQLVNL